MLVKLHCALVFTPVAGITCLNRTGPLTSCFGMFSNPVPVYGVFTVFDLLMSVSGVEI